MKKKRTFSDTSRTAVSLPWIHILVAMAAGPRHGYAIMREVDERTAGQVTLWPATLYGAIRRMQEEGLVCEVAAPDDADDPRRKYYELTERGRSVLATEISRLEDVVSLAHQRNILGVK